jgi:hypothetical protein
MVDEVASLGSASAARSVLLETVEVTAQDALDLGGGETPGFYWGNLGRLVRCPSLYGSGVGSVGCRPQPSGLEDPGHVPDDLHMTLGPVGLWTHRVQGQEGVAHLLDQWPAVVV